MFVNIYINVCVLCVCYIGHCSRKQTGHQMLHASDKWSLDRVMRRKQLEIVWCKGGVVWKDTRTLEFTAGRVQSFLSSTVQAAWLGALRPPRHPLCSADCRVSFSWTGKHPSKFSFFVPCHSVRSLYSSACIPPACTSQRADNSLPLPFGRAFEQVPCD